MVGGYKGSVMESRTGKTLGLLLWADGDGVLAPLILAMAEVKRLQRVGGGARGCAGVFFFRCMPSGLPLEKVL